MNAVPDRIFDRAAREGWKRGSYESMRAVTRVAPLSVPLWSWLAWEDAARFRLEEFLFHVEGLWGALRQYGPGLLGVRGVARSVRLRLGVLVRDLGVAQPPPAGASRADVGRRPTLQRSSPAGVLRLRGRPRRFRRAGRVRGRDRRRRGLLDRALDRVRAPRRDRDRGDGDPAAGRRIPLRRLPRSGSPGGGDGAAGGMAGRGGIPLRRRAGLRRCRTGGADRAEMGSHGAVRPRPRRDGGGKPAEGGVALDRTDRRGRGSRRRVQ